jgi:hypothetical protein
MLVEELKEPCGLYGLACGVGQGSGIVSRGDSGEGVGWEGLVWCE